MRWQFADKTSACKMTAADLRLILAAIGNLILEIAKIR